VTDDPCWCPVHDRMHPVPSMVAWCVDRTDPTWGLVVAADEAGRAEHPDPFTSRRP
jgi:hypothetical protein